MSAFFHGVWVILGLELRQRVRGFSWYVLLAVFVVLVLIVSGLVWLATAGADLGGGWLYSVVIYFVLLLGTLVTPALAGNAINGDRDAGTLATTQVTLVTTWQLVLGKFLAAWISALAFLGASVPFLVFAISIGGLSSVTILSSVLVLALELGVIAAVGVGLSGILTRPLFSIVVTYLVVAALSIGTVIAFGLAGVATQSDVVATYIYPAEPMHDPVTGLYTTTECLPPETDEFRVPRFDHYWAILAANPYVVLADSSPHTFDSMGNPTDAFGFIALGVRGAQQAPDLQQFHNFCEQEKTGWQPGIGSSDFPTAQETFEQTAPSWFVGLGIHVLLGVAALYWAWSRTKTPTGRLARGSRVA